MHSGVDLAKESGFSSSQIRITHVTCIEWKMFDIFYKSGTAELTSSLDISGSFSYTHLDVYKRQIRRFLCISDRVVGILKSSGISGRRDHAAGRNLGVERADTFPCSVASVRRSRASWQLDLVFSWKTRR